MLVTLLRLRASSKVVCFLFQVVRRHLRYEELLRDVRTEKVQELLFFSQRGTLDVEGVCLVAYR